MLLLPCFTLGVLFSGCGNSQKPTASTNAFDFGQVVVPQTSTRDVVTITNSGSATATVSAKISGDSSLKLDPSLSCGTSLVSGGTCSVAVSFTPTTSGSVSGTLSVTLSGGSTSQQSVGLKGLGVQLSGGQSLVTATWNPVVALYSYQPNVQGMVHVEFGPDTSYGTITSSVATPSSGGPVQIFVAGMKQNTTYHMRAVVNESDGTIVDDQDHTFTTSSFPADMLPTLTATTAAGQTPQPGIELADATNSTTNSNYLGAYATDLSGNIIWGYDFPDRPSKYTIIQPIKLLPNGNFIVVLSYPSQFILPGQGVTLTPADESVDLIREIDLAGDPVAQLTLDSLNAKLAAAGYGNITLTGLHHDVTILPNGHMILIGSMLKSYSNVTGYPGTTNVLGDVLVDLDENFNVSWVWSEFDHLDVNRHPIAFPDWTHTNAVVYSPSDGDLLVSIRHQSWIIKIDYQNGIGSGDVLWRLGNGGDFTLIGGTAPEDWFYGQHDPSFVGSATSGQFSLTMMDNGYGRITSGGSQCTSSGSACYTTVPVLAIDEVAKTATISYRQMVPASQFNIWGGNAEVLANGDLEYDLCAEGNGSEVDEVKMTNPAQVVWTLKESGANLYRAHRIPSLYPGVQW
ncbi:MAG TPA: aryl-sulfate sulfotransferase [Acidobacteriaceae bacterium]|nr:aryl-sulfate sulfotransferase [Acidobacteriaceae bacterium]